MTSIPAGTKLEQGQPFSALEGSRLSDVTVKQIANLISNNVLPPGSRLPSERDLIKRLSVSRTSVREALRILEGLGLVVVKPGIGAFVADRSRSAGISRWAQWLFQHKFEVLELLEVREALEPKSAALAAQRRTDSEIHAIFRALETMQQGIEARNVPKMVKADIDFHKQIARASRNQFIIRLSESMSDALGEHRYAYFSLPRKAIVSFRAHRRIAEAIDRGDGRRAFAEMVEHIRHSKAHIGRLGLGRKVSRWGEST